MHTPQYWRERAEAARAELTDMTDPEARRAMEQVVTNCEELAAMMENLITKGIVSGHDAKRP